MGHRFELFFGGLGQLDGVIEDGLDGGLVGGGLRGPRYGDARERFGDEEAVPGAELPGAFGMAVEGADGGAGELGELGDAGLGDHGGAAWTVGGDGAVVAGEVGAAEVAQAGGAFAGAGATDGDEAEALDGAGDEFAIEATADEDGDATIAEAPDAGEQAAVPEGVDGGRRGVEGRGGAGVADIAVAEGDAETADGRARKAGDDGEGQALFQGVGVCHGLSLPAGLGMGCVQGQSSKSLRPK
jgi:hypothetical protein